MVFLLIGAVLKSRTVRVSEGILCRRGVHVKRKDVTSLLNQTGVIHRKVKSEKLPVSRLKEDLGDSANKFSRLSRGCFEAIAAEVFQYIYYNVVSIN